MKTSQLVPALVALAVVAIGAGCAPKKDPEPPKPKVTADASRAGEKSAMAGALPKLGAAPAWTLQDIDGKTVASEDFKGKVVVVDFWATWCGPCRVEIPGYVDMMKKYGKEGLVVVGISLDQAGPDVVKSFGRKMEINYPLLMADEAVLSAFGGVAVIPTTFIIDREGQVRHRKEGLEEDYEKTVLAVLRG